MNKTSIKNYAIWARNELISRVSQKAFEYGVEKDYIVSSNANDINGRLLSNDEKKKRQILIKEVNQKGFDQVMEEAAYTWFNRFIALRFMEVNNYLPKKVRVFTNDNNEFKPQIMDEALHIELLGLDKNKIIALKEENNDEELYKELLLATCNDMSQYLPGMFKPIDDYMTLLFPSNLLKDESVLGRMISDIDEDSWNDQVQIIGWLYQFYISEKHNQVVNINKSTISKDDVPAATQLFTPDWVVRYMVDNSLGRYWIERNPESGIKQKLDFYVSSKKSSDKTVQQTIQPEEITFFDPCMGSGHILVYAFDVLMQIYVSEGWTQRDAAISILKNNIYGLDIDERAYQLSYFALMMKARQYNRRILNSNIIPNVMDVQESNHINRNSLRLFGEFRSLAAKVVDAFIDAKEYGSILNISFSKEQTDSLKVKLEDIKNKDYQDLLIQAESVELVDNFEPLLKQAEIMSNKYECVVTNPPYLNKMGSKLKQFVQKNYKDYSSDLFSIFMKKNFDYSTKDGYLGFMTPLVWMFIKTYEKLRNLILTEKSIKSLIQMEYSAFEEATVPICSFVLANDHDNTVGYYFRLSNFKGGMDVQKQKVMKAINAENCSYFYETDSKNFTKIPGSPIAYWVSRKYANIFGGKLISSYGEAKTGIGSGNTEYFLKVWFEVNNNKISFGKTNINDITKFAPINKGGSFRKWYGNREYIINWENNGYELKNYCDEKGNKLSYPRNLDSQLGECITWGDITTYKLSLRYSEPGFFFSDVGNSLFVYDNSHLMYILGYLNTNLFNDLTHFINQTMHFKPGNMMKAPICIDERNKETVSTITRNNITLSKQDWDSYETSWDFQYHPMLPVYADSSDYAYSLENFYEGWKHKCNNRFHELKSNEEELNRIFIDIYGLHDELTPEVEDKDVTVHYVVDSKEDIPESMKASKYIRTKEDEIKSLISFAVGCMFGRYNLWTAGLAYAGGDWDSTVYDRFPADKDNIIPICDDEYFDDDIVGRFIEFIRVAYGEDTLEENLQFISDALGGKGTSREVIRNYFINDFYKDHCNTYQVTGSGKRPIYWQFDSGKKNGFKALVYIHRYTPDLIARMRTSYIHEQQSRYDNQISMIQNQINSVTVTSERTRLSKKLKKLKEQAEELRIYEEKIHHWADKMEPMDLDDGVKKNYAKFQELLTKIK